MRRLAWLGLLPAAALALSPPRYWGDRALGMGGAFTALSDDYSGLYFNPAGLAMLNTPLDAGAALQFDLGDLFGAAGDAVNIAQTHSDSFDSLGGLSKDNTLVDDLMRFDRRPVGFGTLPEMHFAAKSTNPDFHLGLGAGWFLGSNASFELDKGIYVPSAKMGVRSDLVFKAGAAVESAPGLFLGVSPTLATYSRIDQSVNIRDYGTASDSLQSKLDREKGRVLHPGFGVGWDFGLLYEIVPTELRIGAAAKNLFLTMNNDAVPATYNVGLAYLPAVLRKQGMLRYVNMALDIEDIGGKQHFLQKLNLGAEMNMTLAHIRGGLHSGYPCYGLGLDLLLLQIEFVSWAEETGRFVGQSEARHYLFSVRLGV